MFEAGSPVHPHYIRAMTRSAAMTTAEANRLRRKAKRSWWQFLVMLLGSAVIMVAVVYVSFAFFFQDARWLFQ